MAWSVPIWKILRISQSQFLSGEVCTETRHSSYTKSLVKIKNDTYAYLLLLPNVLALLLFLALRD